MNEHSIRSRARRTADVVISGYSASYAHFLPRGEQDEWGFGGKTMCGAKHRNGRWMGTNNPEERALADKAELCPRCIKTALIEGHLD